MALKNKSGSILSKSQIGFTHLSTTGILASDLNDATDTLTEYYTNNSTAHRPGNQSGTFLVWNHKINSNFILQFATLKGADAAMWTRRYTDSSWSDWVMLTRPLDVYPVGAIYISTLSTNPSTLFGGTWEAIGQGRVLVGSGEGTDINDTARTFAAGSVGGEYSHRLLTSEIPEHVHSINIQQTGQEASGYGLQQGGAFVDRTITNGSGISTRSTGGSGFHENMPPYLAVYMWSRVA